jgi:Molecular chaperone (small heat shock protein)
MGLSGRPVISWMTLSFVIVPMTCYNGSTLKRIGSFCLNHWRCFEVLMRTDPFREMDRIVQQLSGTSGTWSKPSVMPMDAYREGDDYVIAFDLPGVSTEAIDIDVERNMLTVKAERRPAAKADSVKVELSERPLGVFSRQIVLADTLDTERIQAEYDAGVLTLRIPIAERAKPRKISIGAGSGHKQISG